MHRFFLEPGKDIVLSKFVPSKPQTTSFIQHDEFADSLNAYHANNFVQFLVRHFGGRIARLLTDRYLIGTAQQRDGSSIFWQMDAEGKVRTGKLMRFDEETGKPIKNPFDLVNNEQDQCLFGEHLINHYMAGQSRGKRTIAIVENERTAIIASIYMPQYTWMACGNFSNLNEDKCTALRGYPVVLFPDLNDYNKCCEKAKELTHIINVSVSDLLELSATKQEHAEGLDLADYLLHYDHEAFVKEAA